MLYLIKIELRPFREEACGLHNGYLIPRCSIRSSRKSAYLKRIAVLIKSAFLTIKITPSSDATRLPFPGLSFRSVQENAGRCGESFYVSRKFSKVKQK